MDGANAAISCAPDGTLLLQSRGHYLAGGPRERHFALFKRWAHAHAPALRAVLGARYVLYGEWLYAKHTVFYDRLPHYFLEFDVLDTTDGSFLSTSRRRALLRGAPVASVAVLRAGRVASLDRLVGLLGPSRFIGPRWREALGAQCAARGVDPERTLEETDASGAMEGLYVKVEEDGVVRERYKYVRASFLTTVLESGTHWLDRPIVPNRLRPGADIFASPSG
jgi:hypothetical protein